MGKSQYTIRFGGLPIGLHEFEFEIGKTFFKNFEHSEIEDANAKVKAELLKQNNLLQVNFEISGTAKLDCDRCLKTFDFPFEAKEKLVIKHGNPNESNDEILVIPEGQEEFDVSHYIYEYTSLALPARRVPCELNKKKFKCDDEVLKKLSSISSEEKSPPKNENNPLWDKLNKIDFTKN